MAVGGVDAREMSDVLVYLIALDDEGKALGERELRLLRGITRSVLEGYEGYEEKVMSGYFKVLISLTEVLSKYDQQLYKDTISLIMS